MLSDKFWELAKTTLPAWATAPPPNLWAEVSNPFSNGIMWYLQPGHCGTLETGGTGLLNPEETAKSLAHIIKTSSRSGNIMYYCPDQPAYRKIFESSLVPLGFELAYEFIHHGYLTRNPDKGKSFAFVLRTSPEDKKKLRDMADEFNKKPKKA